MAKTKPARDEEREDRIDMEVVVDAYGSEERAIGWYYYVADQCQFPFSAICIAKRSSSPLKVKDKVEVIGIAEAEECEREILVLIRWDDGDLAVPLAQLEPASGTDDETMQVVADWRYWVEMGYEF